MLYYTQKAARGKAEARTAGRLGDDQRTRESGNFHITRSARVSGRIARSTCSVTYSNTRVESLDTDVALSSSREHSGLLQGTVCSSGFDNREATVACVQLGWSYGYPLFYPVISLGGQEDNPGVFIQLSKVVKTRKAHETLRYHSPRTDP